MAGALRRERVPARVEFLVDLDVEVKSPGVCRALARCIFLDAQKTAVEGDLFIGELEAVEEVLGVVGLAGEDVAVLAQEIGRVLQFQVVVVLHTRGLLQVSQACNGIVKAINGA